MGACPNTPLSSVSTSAVEYEASPRSTGITRQDAEKQCTRAELGLELIGGRSKIQIGCEGLIGLAASMR